MLRATAATRRSTQASWLARSQRPPAVALSAHMLRRAAGVAAAGGAAAAAYGYAWAKREMGDDALQRILKFDKVALPAILEYKWEEAKCEKLPKVLPALFPPVSDEEERARFEALHRKWAKPIFDIYMELGGFYYKSGQKVASNMSGIAPKLWQEAFQPFLNDIPPREFGEVVKVIEGELGRPITDVFATFDEKPIGCASIGQAHRATLRTTGERVVVKVQNPDAERTFRGDVFALRVLIDAFMPQLSVAFDEIQRQFATEFDYRGECKNAMEVRANLQRAGFGNVIVPRVHESLCSKKLMVMEEIFPSIPLHTALDEQAEKMARQRGISKEAFIASEKARIESETNALAKQGKLVRQLTSNTYDKYIAAQRAKRGLLRAWKRAYNWTLGLLLPRYKLDDEEVLLP
uniref:ABC1 atypical kinase-like domain-containing protein n=1 Tax=Calcidiscus leptoporus TaxID=127549 RepID=A0A7S0IPC0_9EUKA